ncbi:hypothetical protein HGRIS_005880 [Hohenbuehelia grisea]|uniref:AB hydrolase-1 domain-containing protein n=1 Tax=Hohenbuehelia grisea TaxID=104357 RepID=A0ABR3K0B0_9AGAR
MSDGPSKPSSINATPSNIEAVAKNPRTLLQRAHFALTISGGIYGLIIALLLVPFFQSHLVFLHTLRFPWFAKYSVPEQYGLSPGKTHNFYIQTSDNVTLGAWFVLADPYYQNIYPTAYDNGTLSYDPPSAESLLEKHIPQSLQRHPTIIWFHGNAATRAFHLRISHYQAFASRLKANVLAIDYRGYGDSGGSVVKDGEEGLAKDARAAWDWVMEMKKRGATQGTEQNSHLGADVLLVGHSLGTAVAARLGSDLGKEGVQCRGVVLMSPFASIETLLEDYYLFGLVPLMKPISMIPGARSEFFIHLRRTAVDILFQIFSSGPWCINLIRWQSFTYVVRLGPGLRRCLADAPTAIQDIRAPVLITHAGT